MSEENTSTYENIEEENSIGHVQIAGEVIAIIAGLAATEVDYQMNSQAVWARRIRQRE